MDLSLSKLVRYSSAGERHSEGATGGNQAYCAPEILNHQVGHNVISPTEAGRRLCFHTCPSVCLFVRSPVATLGDDGREEDEEARRGDVCGFRKMAGGAMLVSGVRWRVMRCWRG